ncbi:MAG: hypothetical protein WDN23_01230 [Edaphobacter sp.]
MTVRPQGLLDELPGDRFTPVFHQQAQNLEWLLLKLNSDPFTAQFIAMEIKLKDAKS